MCKCRIRCKQCKVMWHTNVANEPETMQGKLEAQNPRKLHQRHGKIPSSSNSKTDQVFNSKDEQTEQLKNERRQVKESKKKRAPKNTENAKTTHRPKNVHVASKSEAKQKSTQK